MKSSVVPLPVRKMIENDLKRTPKSEYVIARRYGVTKNVIKSIQADLEKQSGVPVTRSAGPKVEPEEIPARLRGFVLEIKAVCAQWSMSEAMQKARQDYDDGLVELCTGRLKRKHGDVLVLYCIPRKKPDPRRRPYFSAVYEG